MRVSNRWCMRMAVFVHVSRTDGRLVHACILTRATRCAGRRSWCMRLSRASRASSVSFCPRLWMCVWVVWAHGGGGTGPTRRDRTNGCWRDRTNVCGGSGPTFVGGTGPTFVGAVPGRPQRANKLQTTHARTHMRTDTCRHIYTRACRSVNGHARKQDDASKRTAGH